MKIKLIILLLGFSLFGYSQKKTSKKTVKIKPKTEFVAELMSKMTLDEKIGQLNLPTSGDITTGGASSSNVAKKIEEGKVGGLFNIKSVQKIKEVQKIAVEKSRLKIPLLFGMDVIHGYETTFPIPLGLSCTWDMKLIERSAQIAAQEASADGINWTFSPMVDISRDPRWGRVSEGSGEDPYLGSQIAKAMVHGYQGDDLSKNNTILSCVKHFALYGAPDAGRDYNTVDMSRIKMYNDYFPPYKAAIDAGVGSVMAMDFPRLSVFRAVARHSSFSRAADELSLSQPAVSKHIRQLEAELGVQLFQRLGNRVELTDAGRILLDYAQRVSVLTEEVHRVLGELQGLRRGYLR